MKWNLRRVESHNAAAIQLHRVHFQRSEIVHPCSRIHGERVLLVDVDLPASEHCGIPGLAWAEILCTEFARRSSNKRSCRNCNKICLLYTSPSPRDRQKSRMP